MAAKGYHAYIIPDKYRSQILEGADHEHRDPSNWVVWKLVESGALKDMPEEEELTQAVKSKK